jgi:CRP-like cAMP-binding protein
MVPSRTRVSPKAAPLVEGNPVRNELLLGVPWQECDSIFSQLTFVELRTHDVLQETEEPIKYAYFVNTGMVSILSVMQDGKSVEVGLTGKEGRMHRVTTRGRLQDQRYSSSGADCWHSLSGEWPKPDESVEAVSRSRQTNAAVRASPGHAGFAGCRLQPGCMKWTNGWRAGC